MTRSVMLKGTPVKVIARCHDDMVVVVTAFDQRADGTESPAIPIMLRNGQTYTGKALPHRRIEVREMPVRDIR